MIKVNLYLILLSTFLLSGFTVAQYENVKVKIRKSTYLYSKPSAKKGKKLGVVRKNQLWDFVKPSRRKKWYLVSNGSVEGWVHRRKSSLVRKKAQPQAARNADLESDVAVGAANEAQFDDQWYEGNKNQESFENQAPSGIRAHDYKYAQLANSFEVDFNFGNVKAKNASESVDDIGATFKYYSDIGGSAGDRFDLGFFLGIHMLDLESFESVGIEVKNSIVFQAGLTLRYLWGLGGFEIGPEAGVLLNFPRLALEGPNAALAKTAVDEYNELTFGFMAGLSVNYRFNQSWIGGLGFKFKQVSKEGAIESEAFSLFNATLGYRF